MLANPFGAFDDAYTIPFQSDRPQSTLAQGAEAAEKARLVHSLVEDDVGNVAFYNGADVGNTVNHDHGQAVRLPDGLGGLPILKAISSVTGLSAIQILDAPSWPLPAFVVSGPADQKAHVIGRIAERWREVGGVAARANLIAVKSGSEILLIYVPRSRVFRRLPGLSGAAGSLEVAGLALACSHTDQQAILVGSLRHAELWQALGGLAPEGVDHLVREVRAWQ
jgi:hypothetical protein